MNKAKEKLLNSKKLSRIVNNVQQPEDGNSFKFLTLVHLIRAIVITIKEFQKNNLSLRAGALAYTIMLSLVPVLAMSTAVVKGLGGGDQLRELAYSYIATLEKAPTMISIPGTEAAEKEVQDSQLTEHLRSGIDQVFDYVDRTNFATLGSFGVAGILFSVILVLSHIETAMNVIWKVKKGRSILRKISDYLTLLVLVPITINIAFAASAFLKHPALSSKVEFFIPFSFLQTLIFQLIPVIFIALTLYIIYLFFPNTKVKTAPALLAAGIAGFCWFSVQNIYIVLQIGVTRYNAIYGSFATLPLFLVWIYLGWVFILAGAQFAYALQNCKNYNLNPTPESPVKQLSATFDIMKMVQEYFKEQKKLSIATIISELPSYQQNAILDIIQQLNQAGVVYFVEDQYLVPAAPEQKITENKIISIILGEDVPKTEGGQTTQKILAGFKTDGK